MVDSAKEEVLLTLGNKLKTKMAAQTRTLYKSVAQVGDLTMRQVLSIRSWRQATHFGY